MTLYWNTLICNKLEHCTEMSAMRVPNTYSYTHNFRFGLFFHFENTLFLFELPILHKLYWSCKGKGWQHRSVSKELNQKVWVGVIFFLIGLITFSYLQNELWLWKTYPIIFRLFWIQSNQDKERRHSATLAKVLIMQYPLFCHKQTWQTPSRIPSWKL